MLAENCPAVAVALATLPLLEEEEERMRQDTEGQVVLTVALVQVEEEPV